MKAFLWGLGLSLLLILVPTHRAAAILLPDATVSLSATAFPDDWPNTCIDPSTCAAATYNGVLSPKTVGESYDAGATTNFGVPYPAGFATATGSGGPAPSISVTTKGDAAASAILDYYFYVNGPADTNVLVTLAGTFDASAAGSAYGGGQLGISIENVFPVTVPLCDAIPANSAHVGPSVNCGGSFTSSFYVSSDTIYHIELFSSVGFAGNVNPYEFGGQPDPNLSPLQSFDIDPVITIDPSFADQFGLLLSPNVGNSFAAVPEPSSLALLSAGLFGLGVVRRRNLRRTPARGGNTLRSRLPAIRTEERSTGVSPRL